MGKSEKAVHTVELVELLHFESLLADISTRYINLPFDQIDNVIEDDQRRICECLGLDLSSLWQWSDEGPRFLTLTHLYTRPGGPEHPVGIDAQMAFPWIVQNLLSGKTVAGSTEDIPPEAAIDRESLRYFGVVSMLNLPLAVGGGPLIGVLTFNTLYEKRDWPEEIVQRLQLVAQIFSNALARKEAEKNLRQSEARLSLAADSAGAGLWELNVDTSLFWTTERALEIFDYAPGEVVDMERIEGSIYPDDLGYVRQAIAHSFDSNEPLSIEYRIRVGDGSVKWINSSGRPYFKTDGRPDRLLGVSIDITDRKILEFQRLRSEERLASAIDIAALGFYEMGENNHIKFFDGRMRELLGIPPEDDTEARRFWLQHIHQEDLPYVQAVIRNVLEEGVNRFALDYRYMHPERGLTWIHHLSRVLARDTAGRATHIIGVMQDMTERKILEETLRDNAETLRNNQKDLQRLAGKLISVQEEELRRLSRELHDDLTQRLAVLAIHAGKLENEMKKTGGDAFAEASQKISELKEQLIDVSKDVHRISRQLHPTIIEDLGLVRAIESELANLTSRENLEISFTHEGINNNSIVSQETSLCLYRIVQEGVKNIISHSGAKKCEISLLAVDNAFCLTVRDDGNGFEPAEVRSKPGLGLSSMRERAQIVGGNFSIDSRPGQGTAIRVTIPVNGG